MRRRAAIGAAALLTAAVLVGPAEPGSAAEPALPPSATDGLRSCPGGGFVLPGSAACIRLSGSITSQTTLRSGSGAGPAVPVRSRLVSSQAQGRVAADLRVPTEAGPLRAYLSIRGRTGRLTDLGRP